jgi:hypothetical protein
LTELVAPEKDGDGSSVFRFQQQHYVNNVHCEFLLIAETGPQGDGTPCDHPRIAAELTMIDTELYDYVSLYALY